MSDPSLEYIMRSRKPESQRVSKTNKEAKQNKSMKLSLRETSCDRCPTLPAALEAFALTTLVFFKGPHFSSGDLCSLILIAAL